MLFLGHDSRYCLTKVTHKRFSPALHSVCGKPHLKVEIPSCAIPYPHPVLCAGAVAQDGVLTFLSEMPDPAVQSPGAACHREFRGRARQLPGKFQPGDSAGARLFNQNTVNWGEKHRKGKAASQD